MNYRETVGQITQYRRAAGVSIRNDLGESAGITFHEEDVVLFDGKVTSVQSVAPMTRQVYGEFDPNGLFPLVHPATGESLGTGTHEQLYVLLHSLYLYLAQQRDEYVDVPRSEDKGPAGSAPV